MDSLLLNIWRENGAYLRFADAKNGIIASIAITILVGYVKWVLIADGIQWFYLLDILSIAILRSVDYFVCAALLIAALLSGISIVPTLKKKSLRAKTLLAMARFFFDVKRPENRGIIYFVDIAGFESCEEYARRVSDTFVGVDLNDHARHDLIEQIWIVSAIGTVKHFTFLISTILVVLAVVLSIFS